MSWFEVFHYWRLSLLIPRYSFSSSTGINYINWWLCNIPTIQSVPDQNESFSRINFHFQWEKITCTSLKFHFLLQFIDRFWKTKNISEIWTRINHQWAYIRNIWLNDEDVFKRLQVQNSWISFLVIYNNFLIFQNWFVKVWFLFFNLIFHCDSVFEN